MVLMLLWLLEILKKTVCLEDFLCICILVWQNISVVFEVMYSFFLIYVFSVFRHKGMGGGHFERAHE